MVNLFCAPMKSITTSQRIEKALGRLRQRYGVAGDLTSEPQIIAIRNGSKVAFNASSMKMYNEDLNTLEVYAFAYDEVDKLSGLLVIDTASRLPNLLKRRYLDYLDKKGLNMSRPGFDSLRDFVAHEIDMNLTIKNKHSLLVLRPIEFVKRPSDRKSVLKVIVRQHLLILFVLLSMKTTRLMLRPLTINVLKINQHRRALCACDLNQNIF